MSTLRKIAISMIGTSWMFAADAVDPVQLAKATAGIQLYAAIGAGLVVIGAGVGIGMFASAAANAISRQPEAAKDITGAVNLPLFLLEGVAIIALVVCILVAVS